MDPFKILALLKSFDWDDGNINKNFIAHDVSHFECEEIFFNIPIFIQQDLKHQRDEKRFFALGKTDLHRYLFVSFTMRNSGLRVISARDMNKREVRIYEQSKKRNSNI